jgi:hypothetical protein
VDTGPLELRDFGPTGRRLGTAADCYDGSPWELHRGELWEQMGSKDVHGIVMALLAALLRTHARRGITVMTDVYCDLSVPGEPSLRAPDVAVVSGLGKPRNENFTGTPILAVEVRGTQSKKYLEEKVELYVERDWPCIWIAHVDRQEIQVVQPGTASVTYRPGASVPLPAELDRYGLAALPVLAAYDEDEASRYGDGWVIAREVARSVLAVLEARGLTVPEPVAARVSHCSDPDTLRRWLALAATAPSLDAFAAAL